VRDGYCCFEPGISRLLHYAQAFNFPVKLVFSTADAMSQELCFGQRNKMDIPLGLPAISNDVTYFPAANRRAVRLFRFTSLRTNRLVGREATFQACPIGQ